MFLELSSIFGFIPKTPVKKNSDSKEQEGSNIPVDLVSRTLPQSKPKETASLDTDRVDSSPGPINALPPETKEYILTFLDQRSLSAVSCLNSEFNILATNHHIQKEALAGYLIDQVLEAVSLGTLEPQEKSRVLTYLFKAFLEQKNLSKALLIMQLMDQKWEAQCDLAIFKAGQAEVKEELFLKEIAINVELLSLSNLQEKHKLSSKIEALIEIATLQLDKHPKFSAAILNEAMEQLKQSTDQKLKNDYLSEILILQYKLSLENLNGIDLPAEDEVLQHLRVHFPNLEEFFVIKAQKHPQEAIDLAKEEYKEGAELAGCLCEIAKAISKTQPEIAKSLLEETLELVKDIRKHGMTAQISAVMSAIDLKEARALAYSNEKTTVASLISMAGALENSDKAEAFSLLSEAFAIYSKMNMSPLQARALMRPLFTRLDEEGPKNLFLDILDITPLNLIQLNYLAERLPQKDDTSIMEKFFEKIEQAKAAVADPDKGKSKRLLQEYSIIAKFDPFRAFAECANLLEPEHQMQLRQEIVSSLAKKDTREAVKFIQKNMSDGAEKAKAFAALIKHGITIPLVNLC